jgi:hypothetical protein
MIFEAKGKQLVAKSAIQVKWYPRTSLKPSKAEKIRRNAVRVLNRWNAGLKTIKVDWSTLQVDFWIVCPNLDLALLNKPLVTNICRKGFLVVVHQVEKWVPHLGNVAKDLIRQNYPEVFDK